MSEGVRSRTNAVGAEIPLAAFPKQFEIDGDHIYVNVPTANHLAVISRAAGKAIATWTRRAATSLFVPELDRFYLAVPAQNNAPAELGIYRPRAAVTSP